MIFKPLFQLRAPAGPRASLSVLIFHRVLPEPDPLFPLEMHARQFDAVCGWLASWFNVLALDEAVTRLKVGTLPARAACLTFDDGYADNLQVALPILQRHGLCATFFIATGFLDGGRMWNDSVIETLRICSLSQLDLTALGLGRHTLCTIENRRAAIATLIADLKYRPLNKRVALTEQISRMAQVALPDDLMMRSSEVKTLREAGMQIGAHTVSHPILARLTQAQAYQEIAGGKLYLEKLLGERISLFAYPNGKPGEDYSPDTVAQVRSLGFDAAVCTQWGASSLSSDFFQIRRFSPWDSSKQRFGLRLLANLYHSQ